MILVFDTSTTQLAIGSAEDTGEMIGQYFAEAGPAERGIHDARLARETEQLLHQTGRRATEISRIGLIIGPGSFTGLRIGLSFAKGLALATGAGLAPFTLHEVMAKSAVRDGAGVADSNEVPDETTAIIPAEGYILAPGFQPRQWYVSTRSGPRTITLRNEEEFAALSVGTALVHPLLFDAPENAPYLPHWRRTTPELPVLARMTALATSLRGREIDGLEPLYVVEFPAVPNKG